MNESNPRFFENPPCASVNNLEIFFAKDPDEPGYTNSDSEYREAKKVCMGCQYRIECAEWGIKHEIHGLWGGLTPRERQRMRRVQRRKSPETALA